MAVAVRHRRVWLYYEPGFVCTCSREELIGVIHHEMNHVLFGHVFADRSQFPNRAARIIAEEITVNEWIKEPLPGAPLSLSQFPELPRDEDTCTRYERLARMDPGRLLPYKAMCHSECWEVERLSDPGAASSIPRTIEKDAIRLLRDQQRRWPKGLKDQLRHLHSSGPSENGRIELNSTAGGSTPLNWPFILGRVCRMAVDPQPAYHRLPRRFPDLVGIIPAHAHCFQPKRVMAVIDTSRSMLADVLQVIAQEISRIAISSNYDLTVVECDSSVRRVYHYNGIIKVLRGRGNTGFRPPFGRGLLNRIRPDVIVYFTDGEGPSLDEAPPIPVIWCLTPRGNRPASWGTEVRIPAEKRLVH